MDETDEQPMGFQDQMDEIFVPEFNNTPETDEERVDRVLDRRPGFRSLEEAKGQVSQEELMAGVDNAASFLVPFYDSGVNVSNVVQEYMKPEDERDYDYINDELGKAGESAALEAGLMIAGLGVGKFAGKGIEALANKVKEYEIDPSAMSSFGVGAIKKKESKPLEIGINKFLEDGKFLKNYDADTAATMAENAKRANAGNKRANALINAEVPEGTRVGVRLNLNSTIPDSPKGLDKLQTLHKGSFSGQAMSYLPFATVRNVSFNVSQKGRTAIASRIKGIDTPEAKAKYPAMSVDGDYVPNKNLLDEGGDLVEIGLNPANHHLFIDLKTGQAVKGAEEATVIGDRVYARGVEYWKKAEAPDPLPTQSGEDILSDVRYKFNQGGVAMNDQMEMGFMSEEETPDTTVGTDPVSGNDIPLGSSAEEVRDDIPAMLSEGEYVVPADVVNYYGVKFFEGLRKEAKQGFQAMEEDGRIGGEPIEDEGVEDLTPEEMQLLQEIVSMEDQDDGVIRAAYGTYVPQNTKTQVESSQLQMPTSAPTPASTQQVQPATTQQQAGGVYGITTASGAPVTSSTSLVNQQPIVQQVVGAPTGTGEQPTEPETGMVTVKYIAPDCRRTDVLKLNGKIISATPADFDVFVPETEESIKRFGCGLPGEEVKPDDTGGTSLTGGGDDNEPGITGDLTTTDPEFDLTTSEGSMAAADYFKEKSGVSVADPFKAAQDALDSALNSGVLKGAGLVGGLLLGPIASIGAGVINAGSQLDALSSAYANLNMAKYLGQNETASKIQGLIDGFLEKAPGVVKFLDKSTELGEKKMEYALMSALSVNAPDDMALTEDRFGSEEAFVSSMQSVATTGMTYNKDTKSYQQTDETVNISTTDGGSVTVGAGSQAATASSATRDSDSGRVVFTPGEKTVRPKLRPDSGTTSSGSSSSSSGPVGVVGNNDTGSNDLLQSVANFFTPDDGKEYVNGKLVETSSSSSSGGGGGGSSSSSSGGGGGGCCFIMLEARYGNGTMDNVVRRYRDEYMTDRNRRGYYKTAEVLVPLMRSSKTFKWIVTKTFADPLVSYGKYYYGENKHGVLFTPVKNFWMKVFDIVGGDTEFIRENGEVV